MRRTKELLKQFEELEMRKNELADEHHFCEDKTIHLHSLEQLVVRQIDIFNILKSRIDNFDGNEKMKKNGLDIFNIIEHHLHLELGRIHAKDLIGLYDLIEDINESCLKEKVVAECFLNLGCERDFDKAMSHLDNNRTYTWVRPRLLGLAVAMSVALSSIARSVLGSCDIDLVEN